MCLRSSETPQPPAYPYASGDHVYPYTYANSSGQLTLAATPSQPLNITAGTAIVNSGTTIYVLDNEQITYTNSNGQTTTAYSQILPFNSAPTAPCWRRPAATFPDDPTLSNPIQLLVESKNKFLYVANQGNNTVGPTPESGIAGYFITTSPAFQLTFISGEPWGTGSGPQCIVEDPSDQYIYTANMYALTSPGRILDPNAGVLNNLRVASTYPLQGPATWCLMDGRTS